jgi:hypothetical protein
LLWIPFFACVEYFRSAECLGNPELKLDISQLSPLLEKDMLAAVTDVFINERKQKFTEWIPNIISSEVKVGRLLILYLIVQRLNMANQQ